MLAKYPLYVLLHGTRLSVGGQMENKWNSKHPIISLIIDSCILQSDIDLTRWSFGIPLIPSQVFVSVQYMFISSLFFLQWQTHQCCLSASSFNVKCCTFTSVLCCCISDMSSSLELSFIPNCPLNCRLVQVTVESIWLCDLWGQLAALWVWNNRISCNGRTDRMTERERGRGKEKTVPSSCQITL